MEKKFYTQFFTILQLPFLAISLYYLINEFILSCPNKDVLTWDADLRFITTLNMMDSIRKGEVFSFLFQIVDSPTWPVLRNIAQIPIFFIFGQSQILDVYLTFFTLIILIFTQGFIFYRQTDRKLFFPIFFFGSWCLLLLSPPILAYSFTGMLEIQGALFYLLSLYYLYVYLQEKEDIKSRSLLFLGIYSFCLFSTKYPYGYMFLFSSIILIFLLYTELFILFVLRYLIFIIATMKKRPWLIFTILIGIIYIFIPKKFLIGKSKNYVKHLLFLLVTFDFYLYFFKQKEDLINLGYQKINGLIQWILLPILGWVLIHPDRFSSSGSTIAHVQTEGHAVGAEVQKGFDYYTVFIRSFLNESYTYNWIPYLLSGLLLISCVEGYYLYYKHKKLNLDFIMSMSCILSILGLTFLTPNHQARHIYHMYPAIIITSLLYFYRITQFISDNKLNLSVCSIFVMILGFPIFSEIKSNFQGSLICFTGNNTGDYALPRWVEEKSKTLLDSDTIHINGINPEHVNKADTELLLNRIAYEKNLKLITNPGKKKIDIQKYKTLLFTGNSCLRNRSDLKHFIKTINPDSDLELVSEIISPHGCIQKYAILKSIKPGD